MLHSVHGYKLNVDVKRKLKGGLLYEVIRWLYWNLHIRDFILSPKASKIRMLEVGYRRQSQDNLSAWKHYKADMEIVDIDSTHNGLFWDRCLISQYKKLIERELGESRK